MIEWVLKVSQKKLMTLIIKLDRRSKMKRTISFLLVLSFTFLSQAALFARYNPGKEPGLAPFNPDFLEYLESIKRDRYTFYSEDGYPLKYIPPPADLSHVIGVVDNAVVQDYPGQYDLRDLNKLTAIRNQGDCGACWTFATFASLESYLMPSETKNFSEQHLNANHGFDSPECEGGNAYNSTAYLARWDGPLNESDVPYPYSSVNTNDKASGYQVLKHVQQVIFLPERSDYLDNDTIKYFVKNYGAVYCAFYYKAYYYKEKKYAYYCNLKLTVNHAAAIVGWDDNFSAGNFLTTPPGNGAFIVRNSWGTTWGDKGYFYLSYYDKSLADFASFNNAESTNNYQTIYQYDPLGSISAYGYGSTTAWGANIFTAANKESLKAVGFYTNDSNVSYEIYVYRGVSQGDPRSGTQVAKKTGSKNYPGYYTVALDSEVSLNKGDLFSVVIKFMNSSYKYPVTVECPQANWSSAAAANDDESFLSSSGSTWTDMNHIKSNTNVCIKAFAGTASQTGDPEISCSRTQMNFTGIIGGTVTGSQSFTVSNSGSGTLNWTLSDNADWLNYTPSAGTNFGEVTVSINASGLAAGSYTGTINITDPNALNSPQTVTVNLTVKNASQGELPFGEFATPTHGSTVRSSIAVTGWVLDDVQVMSVEIYNGTSFVGDAVFVEGARPDVEQAYPGYPKNYRAGWGYMLLTYFLPNGGNGTYTLNARVTDAEGHQMTLGSKTITCDNAHAVKPFGAIDTPGQGGMASGSSFINWGWALTPQPNAIPTDGSTIFVYVDSVKVGSPDYNLYRSDIANYFPGYANSDGGAGRFYLDTTAYENGVHTIQWTARDNAGNTDGIGSRYFSIQNPDGGDSINAVAAPQNQMYSPPIRLQQLKDLPMDVRTPVKIRKGFGEDIPSRNIYADHNGLVQIEIKELERIELDLSASFSDTSKISGYLLAGNRILSLPIGSTLKDGVFYWMPGLAYLGKYRLVFIEHGPYGVMNRKDVMVKIGPKFEK
jgi:C1A family cysteine protease